MPVYLKFMLLACFANQTLHGADIFVSPTGDDSQPGTTGAPIATLAKAQLLARPLCGNEPVTIHVADGTYYMPETLVLTHADSGATDAPVIYRAENEGGAILSGGMRLDLKWAPYRDGIFMAKTDVGFQIDQLFVDAKNQRMARYPNDDATQTTAAYQGFAADAFSKSRAAHWENPAGGYIHAMHRARWGGYHYRITGKDSDGEVTYEGGWQNNRQMGMHDEHRMVENIFEELDAPGEWFHDSNSQTLYFYPESECDLEKATVEVVRLRHLVECRGTQSAPVRHVTVQGFTFRHAARTFMETKEPLLRSDWTIYRGGAVILDGTENVALRDCQFDQLGGNAVFISNYNRTALVDGCHIHDCGASGVCFVGNPDAVRDPLFEYGQSNDLAKIDRTPGPKTANYPADSMVANCLIHGIGRVERQPAGVQISMARRITVRDCSVYDCARAGINIGDGTWGGHLIERNDVFNTVQETGDHGSFNSWGRDRYWRRDQQASQAAINDSPDLPLLDAVETTVICNNRMRCDHGWDIDLDDGSSNYHIYNNLLLNGGLKLREGFNRRAWNNITVNNGLHPHVWYDNSGDEVYGNIFMSAPKGARMPSQTAKGKRVDENLYFSTNAAMRNQFAQFGWDVNSIVADPLFVNPIAGDYRVGEDSPARRIGFENFPMDQFGVKKPSLKAIAKTPVLPIVNVKEQLDRPRLDSPQPPTEIPLYWLGCRVKSLTGEEFSAFGVSKEAGGVALSDVSPTSAAADVGLLNGDLVQAINTTATRTSADLIEAYCRAGDVPLTLQIVRNQQPTKIEVAGGPFVLIETTDIPSGFRKLPIPQQMSLKMASNQLTTNAPLPNLVDGKLTQDYGPVFSNSVFTGVYRMDLGSSKPISEITTWSTNKNSSRGPQRFTLYGSRSDVDPGWELSSGGEMIPLGSIDSTGQRSDTFTATSLRSRQTLGTFRWIYWQVAPVTQRHENTAFQEMHVR